MALLMVKLEVPVEVWLMTLLVEQKILQLMVVMLQLVAHLVVQLVVLATNPRLLSDGDVGDVMEFRKFFQQLGSTPGDQNWQTPDDWLEEDSEDPGYQLMTDNEIVSEINCETTIDSSSEDDELDSSSVSNSKACEAFNTALKWLEAQTDIGPVHLLLVKKWRDIAARKRGENLKQNTISSYFIKQ